MTWYTTNFIVIALEVGRHLRFFIRVHEIWALFFGPTLKDDPRYTPSDVFETFPLPEHGAIVAR